jgi:hypothetical protein
MAVSLLDGQGSERLLATLQDAGSWVIYPAKLPNFIFPTTRKEF